jgi:hypothetical protein
VKELCNSTETCVPFAQFLSETDWFVDDDMPRVQYPNRPPVGGGVAVCAFIKDEAAYLKQWLEFHQAQGVKNFYFTGKSVCQSVINSPRPMILTSLFLLSDNGSEDNYLEVLQPYINQGLVDITHDSTKDYNTQIRGNNRCVQAHRNEHTWIAVFDVDEYLMSSKITLTIEQALEPFMNEPVVRPGTHTFCSNGHQTTQANIVKSFTKRREFVHDLPKSIINTAFSCEYKVDRTSHVCRAIKRTRKIGNRALTLNHYATKSYEDYEKKVRRGDIRNQDSKFSSMWNQIHTGCTIDDDLAVRSLEKRLEEKETTKTD